MSSHGTMRQAAIQSDGQATQHCCGWPLWASSDQGTYYSGAQTPCQAWAMPWSPIWQVCGRQVWQLQAMSGDQTRWGVRFRSMAAFCIGQHLSQHLPCQSFVGNACSSRWGVPDGTGGLPQGALRRWHMAPGICTRWLPTQNSRLPGARSDANSCCMSEHTAWT